MATVATDLANSIDASDVRARLDAVAKKLIKHRIILAEILKECVDEFREFDIKYIEENCFVGEVQVNEVSVDQDMLDADSTIIGSNTEDRSDSEGAVFYDLVFDALVPSTQKLVRLVINIEIQVETKLSYAIVTRGVYYVSRLISRQRVQSLPTTIMKRYKRCILSGYAPTRRKRTAILLRNMASPSRK